MTVREQGQQIARENGFSFSHLEWDNGKMELTAVYVHRRIGKFLVRQDSWPKWAREPVRYLRARGESGKLVPGGDEVLPHIVTENDDLPITVDV